MTLAPISKNKLIIQHESRIAKTQTIYNKDGIMWNVTIDASKIISRALFYNVLLHELGHVHGRRDMSGDIMSWSVKMDTKGRLLQHVPYYDIYMSCPYCYIGNNSITPVWY